jgi:hypothetical protein
MGQFDFDLGRIDVLRDVGGLAKEKIREIYEFVSSKWQMKVKVWMGNDR